VRSSIFTGKECFDGGYQYNALVDLAGRNDIYSGSWAGRPPSSYQFADGIAAGDLLLAGLAIGNGTSSESSTQTGPSRTNLPLTPTSNPKPSTHIKTNKTSVGPIAGGVVGGIAVIALLALLLLMRRRRRYASTNATAMPYIDDHPVNRGAISTKIPMTSRAKSSQLTDQSPRDVEKKPPNSIPSTGLSAPPSTSAPTAASTSSYPTRRTTSPVVDQNQLNQPTTIQSLLAQLSVLMQQMNHSRGENESPPAYSHSNNPA
jgi:hypothetical protein